jgi:F-type H+-transporting ATPase subunit b
MDNILFFAASEASQQKDVISVLGINWMMLIFQIGAFLLLLWLLKKFVYPPLIKSLDDRQAKIEAGLRAAEKSEAEAEKAELRVKKLLDEARKEAKLIISDSRLQASELLSSAEKQARIQEERILAEAMTRIDNEIIEAKKNLKNEMVDLVTVALKKITSSALTKNIDKEIINESLESIK